MGVVCTYIAKGYDVSSQFDTEEFNFLQKKIRYPKNVFYDSFMSVTSEEKKRKESPFNTSNIQTSGHFLNS